ncbi:MAG: TetR/AcrR family transcriptional regulator [Pseudomonadota bacterium]|jgi:AcrR family transcriptional regulator
MAKAAASSAERETFHHGDTRRAAIAAARAIVDASGHQSLTLRGVAEQIGVNHRALYRQFASLEDLLCEVAATGFDELAVRLEEITAAAGGDRAGQLAAVYARFAVDHIHLYTLMFALPLRDHFRSDGGIGPPLRRVVKAAAAALRDGRTNEDAIKTAVLRIWGLAHGMMGLYVAGALRARSKADAVALIASGAGRLAPESGRN